MGKVDEYVKKHEKEIDRKIREGKLQRVFVNGEMWEIINGKKYKTNCLVQLLINSNVDPDKCSSNVWIARVF